jgi:phosphoribosylformylglycinamidine synthase
VVSGNVSLYNEREDAGRVTSIDPTPVIGMVGLLEDYRQRLTPGLKEDGDFVLLAGATRNELGGSEYLHALRGLVAGAPPALDLDAERALQRFVLAAASSGLLHSAHDVAEGGMLVGLAECCLWGNLGVRCPELQTEPGLRLDAAFFGESQGRFILSASSRAVPELQTLAKRHHVDLQMLGMATGRDLEFENQFKVSLDELRDVYESALPRAMERNH